jgi:hypothetical protein
VTALKGYMHCRRCTEGQQTQRLEVGLSNEALVVQCKKHGLVVELTPASLAALLAHPPECECCRHGGPPS